MKQEAMVVRAPRPIQSPQSAQRIHAAEPRERGVVMIIVLLGLILIASLVFYVFNVGRNVQSRVVTQHAADGAAMGGAGWVARTMNTTAMNNVEMARLIAEVNVLDATDQALHPAYHEADTHYRALNQLYPSAGGNLSRVEARFLRDEMDPIIEDYEHDRKHLEPLKRTLRAPAEHPEYGSPSGSIDVREYTFYDGPGGRGRLWQAMEALDVYSQTMMETMPVLAQRIAARGGRTNLDREPASEQGEGSVDLDQAGLAMLAPVAPTIPWERGEFDDFQRPVEEGLLDPEVDDQQYRRGPYDTVFGWRKPVTRREKLTEGNWVDDKPPSDGSGPGGPGGTGPPDSGGTGHWDPPPDFERITIGYEPFGPQFWLLNRNNAGSEFDLKRSPFERNRNKFASWKRQYLWHNKSVDNFRFPVFLIDWDGVTDVGDSGSSGGESRTIYRTRFFVARLESDNAPGEADYLDPGTYQMREDSKIVTLEGDWELPQNDCAPLNGDFGNDPRQWQTVLERMFGQCQAYNALPGRLKQQWASAEFEELQNSDWRKVRFTSRIQRDGESLWQVVYYFCIGIDVGEELPVRNPYNFADRSELPAPIQLNHDELEWNDPQARRETLTFLGVAAQPNPGTLWADGFDDSEGYPNHLALAQAEVFNNHSWDLWTQMWHAQLQPIDRYEDWAAMIDEACGKAGRVPGMSNRELDELAGRMRDIEPLAWMLRH